MAYAASSCLGRRRAIAADVAALSVPEGKTLGILWDPNGLFLWSRGGGAGGYAGKVGVDRSVWRKSGGDNEGEVMEVGVMEDVADFLGDGKVTEKRSVGKKRKAADPEAGGNKLLKTSIVRDNLGISDGSSGRETMRFQCCPGKSMTSNVTRVRKHMFQCFIFQRRYGPAYESFLRSRSGDAAADKARNQRISRDSRATTGSSFPMQRNVVSEELAQSSITAHVSVTASQKHKTIDRLYSDGVIVDALPFTHGKIPGFRPFWKEAFQGTWCPADPFTVKVNLLDSFRASRSLVLRALRTAPAICASADGFTDVKSMSVFNFLAGGPLAFVVESFRLNGELKSSVNLDALISGLIASLSVAENAEEGASEPRVLGFVSDSPHAMIFARKLLCGEATGGSNCCSFAFGCACHGLSNSVEDFCKIKFVSVVLKKCCLVLQPFQNMHVASDLLDKAKLNLPSHAKPTSLKSFSL